MNRRTRLVRSKVRAAVTELGLNATNRDIAKQAGVSVATAHKYGEGAKAQVAGAKLDLPDATPAKQVGGSTTPTHRPTPTPQQLANGQLTTEHRAVAKYKGKCDQCGEAVEPGDQVLLDDDRANRLPGGKRGQGRKPIRHASCPESAPKAPAHPVGPGDQDSSPQATDPLRDAFDQAVKDHDGSAPSQADAQQAADDATSDQQGDGSPSDGNSEPGATSPVDDPSQDQGSGQDDDDPWAKQSWVLKLTEPLFEGLKKINEKVSDFVEGMAIMEGRVEKVEANINSHEDRIHDHDTQIE